MTNPTYVIGRSTRGGICAECKMPMDADPIIVKSMLKNIYDPMLKRNYGVEVEPLEKITYRDYFEWAGFYMGATSPFMLRMMEKMTKLIDEGVKFTAIIDEFDATGKRTTVYFPCNGSYSHHILVAEASMDVQWISVAICDESDLGKTKPRVDLEVNPEFFMHVTGDAKEGFGWECRPKEIMAFMCPDDVLEWLKSTYDVIGDCLCLEREDY